VPLRVEDVTVVYRGLPALSSVSLEVPAGKVVAVLGANGAGKTTLLHAVSGALKPVAGHIWLGDERLDGLPAYAVARRGVYHLPEARGLFRDLSVRENLGLASNVVGRSRVAERLDAVLSEFPMLRDRMNAPAGALSGGQLQMLAIARALVVRPRLLLVDELSFGLAPVVANEAFELLVKLNREVGSTVLLVEQNVGRALGACSYAYVLKNGTIAMQGEPESLLSDRHLLFSYLGAEVPATT
jgi:branched-chain amino acid transport system ATP-binding protein